MAKFKEGDIVQLKSGGPKMTIDSMSPVKESYFCHWFSGKKLESGHFSETSLILAPDNDDKKQQYGYS